MNYLIELLPYWLYLLGSMCFLVGTVLLIIRQLP
jgi:hypothetical protein